MKTAVVIFSRNAASRTEWKKILKSYSVQDIFPSARRILVDSQSSDSTVDDALDFNWEVRTEKICDFNHGLTRNKIALELLSDGYDVAVFATQDVLPAANDTLSVLVESLEQNDSAVSYARQMPVCSSSMDGCFRKINYPEKSLLKSKESIAELGILTVFCSNSLAAWDLHKLSAAGGFPATDFGEDMLLGAKLISNGEKIYYCAESRCYHQHNDSVGALFSRGFAIGKMHGKHPELKKTFGRVESCAVNHIPLKIKLRFCLPLAVKYLGFLTGKTTVLCETIWGDDAGKA